MKINLIIGSGDQLAGYRNINPLEDHINITNLDGIVYDAEAVDIVALDVIDFIPPFALEETLTNWLKKLRRGGKITVGGIDMVMVAKAISRHEIDIMQAHVLLYGEQKVPADYRKSTLSMKTIIDIFQSNGLKIMSKRMGTAYNYIVTAERVK